MCVKVIASQRWDAFETRCIESLGYRAAIIKLTLSHFDKTPTCEVATAIDRAGHMAYTALAQRRVVIYDS